MGSQQQGRGRGQKRPSVPHETLPFPSSPSAPSLQRGAASWVWPWGHTSRLCWSVHTALQEQGVHTLPGTQMSAQVVFLQMSPPFCYLPGWTSAQRDGAFRTDFTVAFLPARFMLSCLLWHRVSRRFQHLEIRPLRPSPPPSHARPRFYVCRSTW